MLGQKYLRASPFIILLIILFFIGCTSIEEIIDRLVLILFISALYVFVIHFPLYLFSKYYPFWIHSKTSKYLGNSIELSAAFLVIYYLFYSFVILSASFVIIVELIGNLVFPDNLGLSLGLSLGLTRSISLLLLFLIVLLVCTTLSSVFFFIMHRLATKLNTTKNKKSEDAL